MPHRPLPRSHLATTTPRADGGRLIRSAAEGPTVGHYRRFLGYWGDGEIDRDEVDVARRKLRAS
ncbi:MAG: hypothetical protein AB7H93_01340 [Vicinamibacterales bacterium]